MGAFFSMIGVSIAAAILAVQLECRLDACLGAWNASLLAAAIFVIVTVLAAHILPDFDEVPAGFPVTPMWKFRVAALEMRMSMWGSLGFSFCWLTERELGSRRVHG